MSSKEIRVKFEVGNIKFEAEGSADLVERERSIFNTLLPMFAELERLGDDALDAEVEQRESLINFGEGRG